MQFIVQISHLKRRLLKKSFLFTTIRKIYKPIKKIICIPLQVKDSLGTVNHMKKTFRENRPIVFYLGIPVFPNLGDQAQRLCIDKWLGKYYPTYSIIRIPSKTFLYNWFGLLNLMKKNIKRKDIFLFQSGMCTSDTHIDETMHRIIIRDFPNNKILFLPQEVVFFDQKEKDITSRIYNKHNEMVFLARDELSYRIAKEMLNSPVYLYPDIVTSMIGQFHFEHKRAGILYCMRDDWDSLYDPSAVKQLRKEIEDLFHLPIKVIDLMVNKSIQKFEKHREEIIYNELELFSKYEVVVTDRFHGMLFSVIANTPVVLVESKFQKIYWGSRWLIDRYPNYVYFAGKLENVPATLKRALSDKTRQAITTAFFDHQYYQKLKELFESETESPKM